MGKLHEFLKVNRLELIERCREKVAQRSSPKGARIELHGIPQFLDQLIKTLEMEQGSDPMQSRKVSGPSGGGGLRASEIGDTAARHGRELSHSGFTVEQVVHDYGDLCQAITDLAFERGTAVDIDEFRTLNRCLDNAIADAVTEFIQQRDFEAADKQAKAMNETIGYFAHELRNYLNSAVLALSAIRAGNVGLAGATGAVLDRSLVGMKNLIDRSLGDVRISAGLPLVRRICSLADFVEEVKLSSQLEADLKQCSFTVTIVDRDLAVNVDKDLLSSALGNLLQNAFKFTRHSTEVTLSSYSIGDRVHIDVTDHCGGLSENEEADMFEAFKQHSIDRSGLGLGLSIARRSVEANGGTLSVKDVPGSGCVFSVNLPRYFATRPLGAVTPSN